MYCLKGKKKWVSNVKKLLYDYRFNYVFGNQTVVNEVVFSSMFKQRIIDCFLQEWYTSKSNSSMLTLYHHLRDRFEYENYLDIVPFDLRYFLLRLRVSSHSLGIQTERYGNDRLPRNERICVYCDLNDIDDELHLLLKCPCLNNLRHTFIPRYHYNRISMFKRIELLKSENRNVLIKLCKFIKLAFKHRNSLISR